MGTKVNHPDHAANHYLIIKKEANPRLIRWMLLFQELDFVVKDRKGCQNQVVDHLFRLETNMVEFEETEIEKSFSDESFWAISNSVASWYTDYANYLVCGIVPED